MKRINFIYLLILPLIYALFHINTKFGKASAFFYGFAENKETEISHPEAVEIKEILVTPGQQVTKGQLLMEVHQSSVDFKIDRASSDMERLVAMDQQKRQSIIDKIQQLNTRKSVKIAEVEGEIRTLKSKIAYNKDLLKDLKSIDAPEGTPDNSPSAIKLKALEESLALIVDPINLEITQLRKELGMISTPGEFQQQKLQKEIDFYKKELKSFSIIAPSDGLIGNILCKEGENIQAFKTLLNFYERNPTIVKGFVHESLILEVNVGDSLQISSSLHPTQFISGEVIGMGTRIVEIPERLRKIPAVKTYGREVLIRIPSSNPFLQKEKVMLNTLKEDELTPIGQLFHTASKRTAVK